MPLHHQRLHRAVAERDLITSNGVIVSVVYVTAKPTFTGVIGGYSTVTDNDSSNTQTSGVSRTVAANSLISASASQQTGVSGSHITSGSSSNSSTPITSTVTSPNYPTSSLYATDSSSSAAAASASATSSVSSSSSDGMPLGAKLGIAIGIICLIGVFAIVPLIFIARKKKQRREQGQAEAEKKQYMSNRPGTRQSSNPDAPRLSLRPVSSLVPEFMGGGKARTRASRDLLTPITEVSKGRTPSPAIALVDRPRTGDNPFRDPENPFADPEKAAGSGPIPWKNVPTDAASEYGHSRPTTPAANTVAHEPTADAFPLPQTQNQLQPTSTGPRALTPDATSGSAEIAELPGAPPPSVAFGPGAGTQQSNVYRILMDFRPTMDDELGLRTGQLVRMLHEYDDGWALCIRLDRSQQGVVPRSCLAPKPSKPRPGPGPAPGPMAQGSRPMTPQAQSRGPGPRPQGPNYGSPRAQGPGSARPQSPAMTRVPIAAPVRSQSPAPSRVPLPESVRAESPAPSRAQGPGSVRSQSPAPSRLQGSDSSPVQSFATNNQSGRSPTIVSPTTGAFNQPPRPLSPGPRPQPQMRGMSPIPNAPAPQSRPTSSAGPANGRTKPNPPPAGSMPPNSPGMAM